MAVSAPENTTPATVARSPRRGPRTTALLPDASRRAAGLAFSGAALSAACFVSLAVGALDVPLREVVRAFTDFDGSDAHVVVTEMRLPRMEIGLLVGGALGAAGALMQGITRNPLAEPQTLGVAAGAAFSVVLAIHLLGVASIPLYAGFALLGAGASGALVYALGVTGRGGATPIKLALAGAV